MLLYNSVVSLSYYLFSVIYPLFRSARIARGKECKENKVIILKFWVVNCIFNLLTTYFSGFMEVVDIGGMTVAGLRFILIVGNFIGSVWIYDNVIAECFKYN